MQQKGKCLALGAGAIGKSVSGYIFTQLGFDFRYAEIDDAVISDINRRGGYDLYTAVSGDQIKKQEIRGICAARVEDAQTAEFAAEADFIVTAVGAANLAAAAASIAGWVRRRSGQKRLAILLFENGSGLRELVEGELRRQLGSLPAWLSVSHASIERISKKVVREDGRHRWGERGVYSAHSYPPRTGGYAAGAAYGIFRAGRRCQPLLLSQTVSQ